MVSKISHMGSSRTIAVEEPRRDSITKCTGSSNPCGERSITNDFGKGPSRTAVEGPSYAKVIGVRKLLTMIVMFNLCSSTAHAARKEYYDTYDSYEDFVTQFVKGQLKLDHEEYLRILVEVTLDQFTILLTHMTSLDNLSPEKEKKSNAALAMHEWLTFETEDPLTGDRVLGWYKAMKKELEHGNMLCSSDCGCEVVNTDKNDKFIKGVDCHPFYDICKRRIGEDYSVALPFVLNLQKEDEERRLMRKEARRSRRKRERQTAETDILTEAVWEAAGAKAAEAIRQTERPADTEATSNVPSVTRRLNSRNCGELADFFQHAWKKAAEFDDVETTED